MVVTPSREPSPAPPASTTEPRVLVPPGQKAAILLFHQRSRDGRLILPLKRSPSPLADLPGLQISPLESTPLEVQEKHAVTNESHLPVVGFIIARRIRGSSSSRTTRRPRV